jgi:hypothetical protein
MTAEIQAGLIGAGAGVLAAVLGAFATYRAALVGFKVKRTRARLRAAYQDLEFFRILESQYLDQLAKEVGGTSGGHQLATREKVRIQLGRALHRSSEPARLRTALQQMADD